MVDQIEGKYVAPSVTEVHERLLNHEAKLLAVRDTTSSVIPTPANAVQRRQHYFTNRNNNNNMRYNNNSYNNNNTNQNTQLTQRSDTRPFKPYLGKYQFCNTHGHSARRCPQLQGLQPTINQQASNPFRPWQPRANLAMNQPYTAANWLLDSGATHHITSDLNNLALHHPYQGGDDVLIADWSGLPITHTGSSTLSTPDIHGCIMLRVK